MTEDDPLTPVTGYWKRGGEQWGDERVIVIRRGDAFEWEYTPEDVRVCGVRSTTVTQTLAELLDHSPPIDAEMVRKLHDEIVLEVAPKR
jgi:hypothetical protein